MQKKIIQTSDAPAAIGTYSQAVQVDKTVYLSGQIPLDPKTMQVISPHFVEQAHQVFQNLRAVATASGGSLEDIVKVNIYLTDLNHFAALNEIMSEYFREPYPARAAIGVAALPKGVLVEVDGVMVLKQGV